MTADTAKGAQRPSGEAQRRSPALAGIALRHARSCGSGAGRACSCRPTYQAQAWSARANKPLRKTFKTLAEARAWRQEAQVGLRKGTLGAPTKTSVRDAAEEWLAGAERGVIRNRSGERYKPSALRSYREALRARILPEFGHLRLSALSRNVLQDFVERLTGEGLAPSTVANAVLPLRAIYRRAVSRGEVAVNPTLDLPLPADRGRRDRVARPEEASALIDALPARDRALWATAMYAGLRRGEL
jgi:integrase